MNHFSRQDSMPPVKAYEPELFERIDFHGAGDPVHGRVRWSPIKSLWWLGMTATWLILGTIHFSFSAVLVFIALSGLTLCLGHSLGMHRKLIHHSFEAPRWLERLLVYLGTLVGLGGPFTMMYSHDIRDWAQRSPDCHDFLSHRRDILTDFWWQLHCKLHLEQAPEFTFPSKLQDDGFYRWLQATSMLQQLPLCLLLYSLGGWGWLAWGVCGRVSVSIFGHWLIGYFAHNQGERDWFLDGASTQGYNLPYLGWITFGECWHNNHHAFPGSAKLGLTAGQFDPGWFVLRGMRALGLVWNLQTPRTLPPRENLVMIEANG